MERFWVYSKCKTYRILEDIRIAKGDKNRKKQKDEHMLNDQIL